jgi:hypothetical protein
MDIDKPKRGRKPKAVEKEPTVKKGRKPRTIYKTFETCNMLPCSSDDEHIIVKLNVTCDTNEKDEECIPPVSYNELIDNVSYSNINYFNKSDNDEDEDHGLKVIELLKDFEEKNKNNEWPQSTSIHCYWCCHHFATVPFGIPLKYVNNKFQVVGCFCSLECAAAHNFDSNDSQDEIWERYNLINLIGKRIGQNVVKCAPTRLALTIFGGHLSIEEFRNYCKTSKIININFPPMRTLTQQIEELNETDVNNDFKYIPVDTERINRYKEKISLRRSKPVNVFQNTLDHAMNLKFGTDTCCAPN